MSNNSIFPTTFHIQLTNFISCLDYRHILTWKRHLVLQIMEKVYTSVKIDEGPFSQSYFVLAFKHSLDCEPKFLTFLGWYNWPQLDIWAIL